MQSYQIASKIDELSDLKFSHCSGDLAFDDLNSFLHIKSSRMLSDEVVKVKS
tara:strand:+ start:5303 stop:5458 length:156 start_codon:yes stop_codon:yes gene_type:complete